MAHEEKIFSVLEDFRERLTRIETLLESSAKSSEKAENRAQELEKRIGELEKEKAERRGEKAMLVCIGSVVGFIIELTFSFFRK